MNPGERKLRRHVLGGAIARATAMDRPLLVSRSQAVPELPDAIERFATAEARGERRFFMASAERRLRRVGLGAAVEIDAPDVALAARSARRLFEDADIEAGPLGGPSLVGGGAFACNARRPDATWAEFGAARFCVPELELVGEGDAAQITWSVLVAPGDDVDRVEVALASRLAALMDKPETPVRGAAALDAPVPGSLERRYRRAAASALEQVRAGRVRKVVIACVEPLALHGGLSVSAVVAELERAHPAELTYAQGFGPHTFVGATPERLVRVRGKRLETAAVAGTAPVGDADLEAAMHSEQLLHSEKDLREHAFVVRAIEDALRPLCSHIECASRATLIGAGRAQHLYTPIEAELCDSTHVLDVVARLHPTPAVGGTPRAAALEVIAEIEDFDRGWYAGPIGWCAADGSGEFFVALRCALVSPGEVRLFAGAGLVEGSDPAAEAEETTLKLRAAHEALELACG